MNNCFFLHVKVIGNYDIYHGDYKIPVPSHVDPYDAIAAFRTQIDLRDIFNVNSEIDPHIIVDQRNINVFVNIVTEDPDFEELEKTIQAFTYYLNFFFRYYFNPIRWNTKEDDEFRKLQFMAKLGVYTSNSDGVLQRVENFISLPIFSIAKEMVDSSKSITVNSPEFYIYRKYVEKNILIDYLVDKISVQNVIVKMEDDDNPTIKIIFPSEFYTSSKEDIQNSIMYITKHMVSKEWREYKKVFEKKYKESPDNISDLVHGKVLTIDYNMISK